ncbi:pectate lyase-like adhesive domain-containing protein [Nicoliella lavandulae]|uniref:Pectate lyase-like adhesive domain-containing protein n=1 Tax=Nicoliella lavandulae TaxID=3082954 RepID=A0ABU8SN12_9LACO
MFNQNQSIQHKKKLKKVKKRWIVVSSVVMALVGGGYLTNQSLPTVSADTINTTQTVRVANQAELLAALQDESVNRIKVTQDIDVSLDSLRVRIAGRAMTIDLNQHTVNLNQVQLRLSQTANNYNILIQNGTLKGTSQAGMITQDSGSTNQVTLELSAVSVVGSEISGGDAIIVTHHESAPNSNESTPASSSETASSVASDQPSSSSATSAEESKTSTEVPVVSDTSSATDQSVTNSNTSEPKSEASSANDSDGSSATSVNSANSNVANSNPTLTSSQATHSSARVGTAIATNANNNRVTPLFIPSYPVATTHSQLNRESSVVPNNFSAATNSASNSTTANSAATSSSINNSSSHHSVDSTSVTNSVSNDTAKPVNNMVGTKQSKPKKVVKRTNKVKYLKLKKMKGKLKVTLYRDFKLTKKMNGKLVAGKQYRLISKKLNRNGKLVYQIKAGYLVGSKQHIKLMK